MTPQETARGEHMLSVADLYKSYATTGAAAVRGVSFSVARGQFFTLLGPSGCGKSTTLQCVAGLEHPDGGEIGIGAATVFSSASRVNVPSNRRRINMMFQSYAIWPHMTVYENVVFPIRHGHQRLPKKQAQEKADAVLELVRLSDLAATPAPFLSGGQQQRVALARALISEPDLLLLDEPLSNLDAKLRDDMRVELAVLLRKMRTTVLYVTHDQGEAMSMSDRVAVMKDGRILQEGAPREIYETPGHPFVARFIGRSNFIPAKVVAVSPANRSATVTTELGRFECRDWHQLTVGSACFLAARPETIGICSAADGFGRDNTVAGKVTVVSFLGDRIQYEVQAGNQPLAVVADPATTFGVGEEVSLQLPSDRVFVVEGSA